MESPRDEDDIVLDLASSQDFKLTASDPAEFHSRIPQVYISDHDSSVTGHDVEPVNNSLINIKTDNNSSNLENVDGDEDSSRKSSHDEKDGVGDEGVPDKEVTVDEKVTDEDIKIVTVVMKDGTEEKPSFDITVADIQTSVGGNSEELKGQVMSKEENQVKTTVAKETSELEIEGENDINLEDLLKKKMEESESDSEFDFDLPPPVQVTSQQTSQQVSQQKTSQPPLQQSQTMTQQTTGTVTVSSSDDTQMSVAVSQTTSATRPLMSSGKPLTTNVTSDVANVHFSGTTPPVAVVKPVQSTTFTPQVIQAPVPASSLPAKDVPMDQKQQRVLASAQAEWENVTTIQAGFADRETVRGPEPTIVATAPLISVHELMQHFTETDFSSVLPSIRTGVDRGGFASFIHLLFGPPRLKKQLHAERDRVFCIAASTLVNEDMSHIRTLQTIYRCLTGSKFDCPRSGSHWEEVGFQGNDPATDLRGTGLLGLLNLLYLLREPKTHDLVGQIYKLSLHPTQNFPFCVMGINLTRIVLQILREDLLNKECNKRDEMMPVVNDFYSALYLKLFQIWKQGKTISDSGYILKDLETQAKKNPRNLMKNFEDYLQKKKHPHIDAEPMEQNFLNVCDD